MNIHLKLLPLFKYLTLIIISIISLNCLAQNNFSKIVERALVDLQNQQFNLSIKKLDSAKALKQIDTAYNESINFWYAYSYENLHIIDSAIFYYGEAQKYFEQKINNNKLAEINNHLGLIAINYNKNFKNAIVYFTKAKYYFSILKDSSNINICNFDIATSLIELNKLDSALIILRNLSATPNKQTATGNLVLLNLATVYNKLNQPDSALIYFDKAINIFLIDKDTSNLFLSYLNKSDVLIKIKNYNKALSTLKIAQIYLTNQTPLFYKKELYLNLSNCYSNLGNYSKAYFYKNLETVVRDSMNLFDITNATAEMETKYAVGKKQDSLVIADKNLQLALTQSKINHRNLLISLIGIVTLILLSFFALLNIKIKKRANNLLSQQKEKVEKLADDLQEANQTKARLFSTISHDLRSPISSLYAQLKLQEIKGNEINPMTGQTINLLDTLEDLLVWSKSQMDRFNPIAVNVNLWQVLEDLKTFYTTSASLKSIIIVNNCSKNIDVNIDENIFKTILRNAIANAINHSDNNSVITFFSNIEDNKTACCIGNFCTPSNFILFKNNFDNAEVQSNKTGFGLILIKEFAKKLNVPINIYYKNDQAIFSILI